MNVSKRSCDGGAEIWNRINKLFGKAPNRTRRSLVTHRPFAFQELEERIVFAYLFVEFGDNFPAGTLATTQGEFRDVANDPVPGNRILGTQLVDSVNAFNAATPLSIVRQAFTATNRAEMMAVVRRAYLPLNVAVVELTAVAQMTADGRNVAGAASMTDVINTLRSGSPGSKDAYIFVATFNVGGANPRSYGAGGGGNSPGNFLDTSDLTAASNAHDDVAVVYSAGGFTNNTMNNISHEAGHCFGLRHAITNATGLAAIDLFHQIEIMSYRNTNNTTSSTFARFPMVRGDANSPGGPVVDYNSIAARTGDSTTYDQLRTDANLGQNPSYTFVSGTGAHDIITITKDGAQANVTVEAFGDATFTTAIAVPGVGGTVYSYTIPLTQTILVYAGGSNDRIIMDSNLGVNVEVDGMRGTDTLRINGLGAASAVYTPRTSSANGVDRIADFGGQIVIGSNLISFANLETAGSIEIDNIGNLTINGSSGNDLITAELVDSSTSVTGTVSGVGIVPLLGTNVGSWNVDSATGVDTLTLNLSGGDFIPTGGFTFNAGAPSGANDDQLVISGGSQGNISYDYTSVSTGSVSMSNFGTVNFTGLERISNTGDAIDTIVNLPNSPNVVLLADDGIASNGTSQISSLPISFPTTRFSNPTNRLTVNPGQPSDTVQVASLPDVTSSLSIGSLVNSFSSVNFAGSMTMASQAVYAGTISLDAATNITSPSGSITLVADNISIHSSSSVSAPLDPVFLRPISPGALIDVGGADAAGKLGLTDAELDRIQASTIVLGSAASGTLTVSAGISRTVATNLELESGNAIRMQNGTLDSAGGSLRFQPGIGGVQPLASGVDAIGSSLTFSSPSKLAINIDGATVDMQYTQLNLAGSVDLSGVSLQLINNFSGLVGTEVFTIVTATGGVNGTFSSLPNGTQILLGTKSYRVQYTSNEVQLQPSASSVITNRRLFYNRSTSVVFGNGSGNPINAIDPTKQALLPGEVTTTANYSNYSRGLNGLVIDIANVPNLNGISAASFQFATWSSFPDATPNFVTINPAVTVSTFVGGGLSGSDRVKLEFANNVIQNAWLRVTMLADANTGLVANDVFYFGNARFDVTPASPFPSQQVAINAFDVNAIRARQGLNSGVISNIHDVDRSGIVNAFDTNAVRSGLGVLSLRAFTAPAASSFGLAALNRGPSASNVDLAVADISWSEGYQNSHEKNRLTRRF
jgi:hypothetical protein